MYSLSPPLTGRGGHGRLVDLGMKGAACYAPGIPHALKRANWRNARRRTRRHRGQNGDMQHSWSASVGIDHLQRDLGSTPPATAGERGEHPGNIDSGTRPEGTTSAGHHVDDPTGRAGKMRPATSRVRRRATRRTLIVNRSANAPARARAPASPPSADSSSDTMAANSAPSPSWRQYAHAASAGAFERQRYFSRSSATTTPWPNRPRPSPRTRHSWRAGRWSSACRC